MRIARLSVRNYRTLQTLDLTFPSFYSAVCGRNDSGKTNVVNVVRTLLVEERRRYYGRPYSEKPEFSVKDDFTKWIEGDPKKRKLYASFELLIDSSRDAGLYSFLVDYLAIQERPNELQLLIEFEQTGEAETSIAVKACNQTFDGLKAEEVLKRFRTSPTVLFHSSTDRDEPFAHGSQGALREISEEHFQRLETSQRTVNNVLRRIARDQEEKIEDLLGRLGEKYRVRLTCPTFDLSYFPYNITLGDRKLDVGLDDWGAGPRNRTLILLTIFRAKQVAESGVSASKVTPVIVVEGPESILHPLAQAEFGRVLQDLSEEFQVQIIVTTHSPYLLSQARPESNILLERKIVRRQLRHTERVDTTGDRWMEPFALSLGLSDDSFRPWRDLFFSQPQNVLLVEGDTDRDYFELLLDERHGRDGLRFDGVIFAYGGRDTLKNQALLRFIRDRFDRVFVTFDLDSREMVERSLATLGMQERHDYLPIGVDEPGKRKIEGLLPDAVRTSVHAANAPLVDALSGTPEERREAERQLKRLYVEEFKRAAVPGGESYRKFYEVTRIINRAFSKERVAAPNDQRTAPTQPTRRRR